MSQSLSKVILHIIFSTKDREPRWIETRFQRLVILAVIGFLGRCRFATANPSSGGLAVNAAPLALDRCFFVHQRRFARIIRLAYTTSTAILEALCRYYR